MRENDETFLLCIWDFFPFFVTLSNRYQSQAVLRSLHAPSFPYTLGLIGLFHIFLAIFPDRWNRKQSHGIRAMSLVSASSS